ncbi:hypothetical protein PLEOSDRAFT_1108082 [Pleurotus ostreatus PC15]|uniref:Uncharacterized protein n=1 Tax=Pleurotus ostreatus (strain PC15) TaxID=1137138 RepID=A0A067NHJ8_PLEO1|nr:hypothetical protein PLEOSDRAFT_1108082 [Pleurotus ostreatus PC15]
MSTTPLQPFPLQPLNAPPYSDESPADLQRRPTIRGQLGRSLFLPLLNTFNPTLNVIEAEVPHRAPFSKLSLIIDDYAHPRRAPSTSPELGITLCSHALRNSSTRAITDTPTALLRSANRHAATRTPIYLNSLAMALFGRFQRNGDLLDLQDAVSKFREAASLPGASASARQSTTFAVALCAYFFVSHDLNDLDEAISKFKQAVSMTPDGHPDLPGYVANLRDAYALQRSCTCYA